MTTELRAYAPKAIAEILRLHLAWFNDEPDGKRADLTNADLTNANLRYARLWGADLRYANLSSADLTNADLTNANLRYARLWGADLSDAKLSRADLYRADLSGADLYRADLSGAKLNWNSHNLLAEILRQAAGADIEKRKLAGLVFVCRDWCWKEFLQLEEPLREWALDILAGCVQDGDNAPQELQERRNRLVKAATSEEGQRSGRNKEAKPCA